MNLAKCSIPYLTSRSLLVLFAGVAGVGTAFVLAGTSLLVTLSCLTIAFSFWLMQKTVGVFNLRALSIPAFCYLIYVGTVFIPSFFVYMGQRDPFRFNYLFAVESALLTIPLGILFMNRIFRFHRAETRAFYSAPVQHSGADMGSEVYLLFLVLALAITCLYISEVRTIPLFYMIKHPGQSEFLGRLREESFKLLDSPLHYVYSLLGSTFYPFLIVLGLGRYLQTKQLSWAALFLAALVPGVLFAGLTISKAPVAALCLQLCVYFYLYRRGIVGAKFTFFVAASIIAFPSFVIMEQYKGVDQTNFFSALQSIGHRIFYLPAEVLYYYFEVFPHVFPYQQGKTIGKLAILMGQQTFDSANAVGRYMYPEGQHSITANAPFLGNLNADFGVSGVLVGGFLVGVILQAAQIYVVRQRKSVLNLALYTNLLYSLHNVDSTALPIAILSDGPIFILLLAWTMRALESMMHGALRVHSRLSHLAGPVLGRSRRV